MVFHSKSFYIHFAESRNSCALMVGVGGGGAFSQALHQGFQDEEAKILCFIDQYPYEKRLQQR